jgi:hypothetical protein
MPRGTSFRIFPVDMEIDRLGDDDHAFSFDWVEGKQYWFEIVHDLSKDQRGMFSHEIRMIDAMDRADRMVIPLNAEIRDIAILWRRILDIPGSLELQCARHNEMESHWGFREGDSTPLVTYTIASDNNRGNATIYEGSETFKADQIGRLLVIKVPPFAQARIEAKTYHVTLFFDGEWIPLGPRV